MSSTWPNEKIAVKKQNEMAAFKAFAAVCGLELLLDTAVSVEAKNQPDVTCALNNGVAMGFELVECDDVTGDGTKGDRTIAVTKIEDSDTRLRAALEAAFHAAVETGDIVRPERFEHHTIEVDLVDGATELKCQNAIPRIIKSLNKWEPGVPFIVRDPVRHIRCTPFDTRSSCKGPIFYWNSHGICVGLSFAKNIGQTIREKNYDFKGPVYLVAWSQDISAQEMRFGEDEKLADLLKTLGKGPFARIWVYGRRKNEIAFDSDQLPMENEKSPTLD